MPSLDRKALDRLREAILTAKSIANGISASGDIRVDFEVSAVLICLRTAMNHMESLERAYKPTNRED